MIDESDLVMEELYLNTTGFCSRSQNPQTADSGWLIEGYISLAHATGDSSWRTRYAR